MTGNDLVKFITENKLENSMIRVGCQGYVSDFDEVYLTKIIGNNILIHDDCYYGNIA